MSVHVTFSVHDAAKSCENMLFAAILQVKFLC